MKVLPYRAETLSGDVYEIAFPLHEDTQSAVRVGQLVDALLACVDREVRLDNVGNGDVLQAMSMALAIRAAMVPGQREVVERLITDLLRNAMSALDRSDYRPATVGHA